MIKGFHISKYSCRVWKFVYWNLGGGGGGEIRDKKLEDNVLFNYLKYMIKRYRVNENVCAIFSLESETIDVGGQGKSFWNFTCHYHKWWWWHVKFQKLLPWPPTSIVSDSKENMAQTFSFTRYRLIIYFKWLNSTLSSHFLSRISPPPPPPRFQ